MLANLHCLFRIRASKPREYKREEERVDCCADSLIERKLYNGIGDGQLGFEDLVGLLLSIKFLFVGGGSGANGRGRGDEVC